MSDFLGRRFRKYRLEYLRHCSSEVRSRWRNGAPITYAEWEQLRINSYERELLIPLLDDEAFAQFLRDYLKSGAIEQTPDFAKPPATYTEGVEQKLIHQLLQRFSRVVFELRER